MAGASLFALFDDIAAVLDDVAVMSKVAAKKTAGVLGDDLALNAEQVSGVRAERELPVVWAVAKGSMLNKLILVPAALVISAILPQLILPALMLGGLYLCYEGSEKIWHHIAHRTERVEEKAVLLSALQHPEIDLAVLERDKIRGAIRTDFILSAEIIVIVLGTVASATLLNKALVLSLIAFAMTIGVYGLVAFIVKLDDMALYMVNHASESIWGRVQKKMGLSILAFCPWLMKSLSVIGTIAMFLVGGGIITHGIPMIEHAIHSLALPLEVISVVLMQGLVGLLVGAVAVVLMSAAKAIYRKIKTAV
ncbi:DUF808 domain-containing protein [uncultured Umboniibacter sp.]|uniref:DUF808 domain-containing protein n=1 Tax=uncultured Umboniibacter sp. TaxID=1798917 RepID=UPI00262292E4|nr:DUF808 domain-containing protein [uncultured Umboniibacter sp.]